MYKNTQNFVDEPLVLKDEVRVKSRYQNIDCLVRKSNEEFYLKAPENVKCAINLRKCKDKKTEFLRQLEHLNYKINVYKTLQGEEDDEVNVKAPPKLHKRSSMSVITPANMKLMANKNQRNR